MSSAANPKKVLLVLPEVFNSAGGIQMFCRALCLAAGDWAHDTGAAVSALVLNDKAKPDARYVNGSFTSYSAAGKSKAKFIAEFVRLLLSQRYDWIVFGHVFLAPLARIAKVINPRARIGIAAYGIEVWIKLSKLQRESLQDADVVLAISEYTKERVATQHNVSRERIKLFPCTLDPLWKLAAAGESSEKSESAETPETSRPVILTVARLSKSDSYKSIDNVIRSLPAIVRAVGPVEFRVVGSGDDQPRLRALAAGLGVARFVNFLGGIPGDELQQQYKDCALFVMPSNEEGFGIVFLEAMAHGKPAIGGANGGTPSVIVDGETGLLVDSFDVTAIGDAIIRLINDRELGQRMGQAGHERLAQHFTFATFAKNFREVLHSA